MLVVKSYCSTNAAMHTLLYDKGRCIEFSVKNEIQNWCVLDVYWSWRRGGGDLALVKRRAGARVLF